MTQSGGSIRRVLSRTLATGALLGLYVLGTVAATGVVMTAGTSSAMAQRGVDEAAVDAGVGAAGDIMAAQLSERASLPALSAARSSPIRPGDPTPRNTA